MRKYLVAGASLAALAMAGAAHAGNTFVNGGFEDGTLNGWEQGGGYWGYATGNFTYPVPNDPANFPGNPVNTVTSAGFDPLTNNHLATVYNGLHSVRVNNSVNDYSYSVIRQTVTNYNDTQIAFAYAAVLQSSHGPTDSDAFIIQLTDLTTGTDLFTVNINSATALANQFHTGAGNWFYTDWTPETIAVTAGHDYQLALLANDCPYGGHAGYAYLDGFGAVVPPQTGAPEPATWALLIAGFGLAGTAMRRRRAALAA